MRSPDYDFLNPAMGFTYEDLYNTSRLNDLRKTFYNYYATEDADGFRRFETYIKSNGSNGDDNISDILMNASVQLSRFIGELFNITKHLDDIKAETEKENFIFSFKKDYIQKRFFKNFKDIEFNAADFERLNGIVDKIKRHCFSGLAFDDDEFDTSVFIKKLSDVEKDYRWYYKGDKFAPDGFSLPKDSITFAEKLLSFTRTSQITDTQMNDVDSISFIFNMAELWLWYRYKSDAEVSKWTIFFQPTKTDYENLVSYKINSQNGYDVLINRHEHYRERDGFKLNDIERTQRQFLNQVDYCMYCHDRKKDSCSSGYRNRFGELQRNPLGNLLHGCPLDEKISEAHLMRKRGYPLASLTLIMIDNPMCPGTGHRICNDCMKGCIYQKQEPVNTPLAESTTLREVLGLPYGFEIYNLLTKWNPIRKGLEIEKIYNGKNVLVTGLGPAGYTLAHYLLNLGYGVVAIDGLKIERVLSEYTLQYKNGNTILPKPVKDFKNEIYTELDNRIQQGFGGVTEYGITVRWDKNFLTVIYLTLMRRKYFSFYDGVTLGNTITIDDVWELGFSHLALCTGAAKPNVIPLKNNLIGGIRKSTDFLMQLQLSGAQKDFNLTSMQISLPAIVIGGGLTAIDCATEIIAYYPIMTEKMFTKFHMLDKNSQLRFLASLDDYNKAKFNLYLEHGLRFINEKALAHKENRKPSLVKLINEFGGVKLIYRKRLTDTPSYRENHEEVVDALEQGVQFINLLSPVEAISDKNGTLVAVNFEKQSHCVNPETNKVSFNGTGEIISFPARTLIVAAGTSPNTIYNDEHQNTFSVNEKSGFFETFDLISSEDSISLERKTDGNGFFTSYLKNGKTISFFGDCHPNYFGSVVKAMASAKNGYSRVADSMKNLNPNCNDFHTFTNSLSDKFKTTVENVATLSPEYIQLRIVSKNAALKWQPGQFFKLQNYEVNTKNSDSDLNYIEPVFLSPNLVNTESGIIEFIINTAGFPALMLKSFQPGDNIFLTGPSGTKTFIPEKERVMLAAEESGNSYMLPVLKALKRKGNYVIFFSRFKNPETAFDTTELEKLSDEFYSCFGDSDNILSEIVNKMNNADKVDRIYVNGGTLLMRNINSLMHSEVSNVFGSAKAVGTLHTTLQCMMNGICGECLQEVRDKNGKSKFVYGCLENHHELNCINFDMYNARLQNNEIFEKLNYEYLNEQAKS